MNYRRLCFITLLVALAASTSAEKAHAQLGWTFYGVGEFDTSDVLMILGGVSVGPSRQGWVPVAGASASWLTYPSGVVIGRIIRTLRRLFRRSASRTTSMADPFKFAVATRSRMAKT